VLRLDLTQCHVDFLSVGGHKWLLAPIGTGIFYCRKASMEFLHPANVGYHSADKSEDHLDYDLTFRPNAGRFEEALVNFPGIWGLEAAVNLQLELGPKNVERHILDLNAVAKRGLEAKGYEIVSPPGSARSLGQPVVPASAALLRGARRAAAGPGHQPLDPGGTPSNLAVGLQQ
jgi:selenocysteine lyase/cysteine desulfurase